MAGTWWHGCRPVWRHPQCQEERQRQGKQQREQKHHSPFQQRHAAISCRESGLPYPQWDTHKPPKQRTRQPEEKASEAIIIHSITDCQRLSTRHSTRQNDRCVSVFRVSRNVCLQAFLSEMQWRIWAARLQCGGCTFVFSKVYFIITGMSGESYTRWFWSFLFSCDMLWALTNSVSWPCTRIGQRLNLEKREEEKIERKSELVVQENGNGECGHLSSAI